MKLKDTLGGYVTSALHQCRQNWSTQKCLSQWNVCCYLLSCEFIRVERKLVCLLWLQSFFFNCVCRLKESCPRWRSAEYPWSLPAALQCSSPSAEKIRQGRWTHTYLSSSWSHLDWSALRYSPVRLCTHPQCWGKSSAVHSWKVFILMLCVIYLLNYISIKTEAQRCKICTSMVLTVV